MMAILKLDCFKKISLMVTVFAVILAKNKFVYRHVDKKYICFQT